MIPCGCEWEMAVVDAMILAEMVPRENESVRDALNRLIAWEQSVALDPAVSEEARKLSKPRISREVLSRAARGVLGDENVARSVFISAGFEVEP